MTTRTSPSPDAAEPGLLGGDTVWLRAVLDAGNIGLWEYDHVVGNLRWSGKVREMLGSDGDTPVRVHPDDAAHFDQALAGGDCLRDLRLRLRRHDGQWLWVGCNGGAIAHDDSGRPLRSAGTLQDVSATMALETRLAEQEERLRLVTDTITEVFYVADNALERIFFVSPAYERIWGRPVAELYANPRSFLDAVHPEDLPALTAALATHLEGEPLDQVYRILRDDGSLRWIWDRGFPVADASGVVTRYVGLAQDITRRKLAEAEVRLLNIELEHRVAHRTAALEATARALADSEQRYRTIVESVQEGIWLIDAEARTSFANRKAAEMLGYTSDEMAGRLLFDFIDETWRDVARENLRRRAGGIVEQHEFRFRRKNGSPLWALISTNPIRAEDGSYAGALATLVDIGERKQAEDLNRKLAGIIEASSDLIATITPTGQIEYMNRAGRALLGIAVTAPLDQKNIEDFHPAWAYRRVVEEGIPAALAFDRWLDDTVLLACDGSEIPVSQLILAQKDRDTGQLELISTICRDMRAHLRANEALRHLQQEQELILDSVPAMIFYKDTGNRILRVNGAVATALGLPKDRIEGRRTAELFPAEAERYYEDDLIVIRSGRPRLGIEEPIRVAGEGLRWLSTDKVPLKDAGGRVTGVLVMAVDITERKLAEAALRHSREDLSRAQTLGKIGSWRLNPHTAEITWSAETHRIFGTPSDAPIDYEGFLSIVHPDDRDYVDRMWQAGLRGEPYEIEHRVVVDGRLKWVSEKSELEFDGHGRLTSAFGTVQDITERKHAEEALQDADRRKDEFIATLAHELRNPLAPIKSAVQILQMPNTGHDTRTWCSEVIERQTGHLTRLVDDLLDISRITRGLINLNRQRTAVTDIVHSAVETSRPLIEARHHALVLDLPSEPLYLDADSVRLAQVVSNLLNNAAKYTEIGGNLALRVERNGDEIVLRVQDDGLGIPAASLPHVFDRFSQVNRSLEKSQGGLGIGLSLAHELVALHGGTITAYSEGEQKGSEFVVRLAAATPPGSPEPDRAVHADRPRISRRIVVVDDNRDAGDSLAELLRALGHEVHIARDGLEALAAAEAHRPQFILMDLGMPNLNGYDACRRIRDESWGQDIVITALSGWGQTGDKQRSAEAGFTHHLTKPVDLHALRHLIDTLPAGID